MCVSGHNTPPTRYLTIFFSLRIEPAAVLLFSIENRAPTPREKAGATERARARERGQERERESARERESKRDQKQARARILREFDFPGCEHTHCDNTRYEYLLLFFFFFTPRYDYWTSSSHHHPSRPCVSQDAHVTTGDDDDDDDGGRKDTAAFMDETFLLFKFLCFTARFRFERGVN